MKILDIYVSRIFLRFFVIVLLVPGGLFSLFALISLLDQVGKGTFTTYDAINVVLLTTPERFIELIPVSVFLGTIAALGRLSDRGELIAMEACGRSVLGVFHGIVLSWLLITVISTATGELLVPHLDEKASAIRLKARSGKGVTYTRGGFWAKRNNTFIHVGSLAGENGAKHVAIYQFNRDGMLTQFTSASSAIIKADSWLLQDVTVRKIHNLETKIYHLSSLPAPAFLKSKDMKALELSPESLSTLDLWSYIRALEKGGQNTNHFLLALWRKITRPLFALALAFLATAFLFQTMGRAGMGPRMVLGAVVGLGFYFFDKITMQLGLLWAINPVVTAFIPVGMAAAAAIYQIKKVL